MFVIPYLLISVLSGIGCVHSIFSIDDFGALPNVNTWKAAVTNANALLSAFLAANISGSTGVGDNLRHGRIILGADSRESAAMTSSDRTILIPARKVYYMTNVTFPENLYQLSFQIEGTLRFSDDISNYGDGSSGRTPLLYFRESVGLYISGSTGVVDGQGLKWWRLAYTGNDHRPVLFEFYRCRDLIVSGPGLLLLSSPRYSINFVDCADIVVHGLTIFIDSSMLRVNGTRSSVTYPLNTDGIDIAAYNVTIYNTNITNYDDAIVAKPCRSTWKYCTCSGSILAYDNFISYSTGLTIGSVPPNPDVNCVRGVTFRDTYMYRPLKALYIKSNPGTSGIGIIDDITYENIHIHAALWWTIWIGPQQQNQPGSGDGTGCNFLFPFIPVCPTQPLVTISRITLRNILAEETVPLFEGPGVILCDTSNPCTEVNFYNVTNNVYSGSIDGIFDKLPVPVPREVFPTDYRSDDWEFKYITSNVFGVSDAVEPEICLGDPDCFWTAPSVAPSSSPFGSSTSNKELEMRLLR